jgi:predicted metal-dependent HD superfamily phosphohydrolase
MLAHTTGEAKPMEGLEVHSTLQAAEEHVTALLTSSLPAWAVYHDLEHTRETVNAARTIGGASGLPASDLETVMIAAWFHDVGYVRGPEDHEERSAQAARDFLSAREMPHERIMEVMACIRATRMPHKPRSLPEQVLCDADIIHVGKKRFFDKSALLRAEMEMLRGRPFSQQEWLAYNIEFVTGQNFHTLFAQEEFSARRAKNLLELQERFRSLALKEESVRAKRTRKEERTSVPERGIETMFRVVPKNHLDLTALADHKASIMISTNALIMSIVFGLLVSKLDSNPHLMFPTFLLLGVCLAALSVAILATRPQVTSGTFSREDIHARRVNLLFFGNFHRSSLEDFQWAMKEMMQDREFLYGSMIKDLYYLGKVLGLKYRYLRICYSIFMYGMILVVIAFGVAFLTMPPLVQ